MKPNNIFQDSKILREFSNKIKVLNKLNHIVLQNLNPDIAKKCSVANFKNGILTISTVSPVFKHQLNFSKFDLLSKLRHHPELYGLKYIEIKIDLNLNNLQDQNNLNLLVEQKSKNNFYKKIRISEETSNTIQEIAKTIKNSKLSNSLARLAKKITS